MSRIDFGPLGYDGVGFGQIVAENYALQLLKPREVIPALLVNIFRIREILEVVIYLVGFATLLLIVLVFALSLQLGIRELELIYELGG
jgi:hypothetical protein